MIRNQMLFEFSNQETYKTAKIHNVDKTYRVELFSEGVFTHVKYTDDLDEAKSVANAWTADDFSESGWIDNKADK